MDRASVGARAEYGDERTDATKRKIDDRRFYLENCPNVVDILFKVAQTG